jgi:ABC-type antimicrobial peptide transport system permease subunit
MVLTENGRRVGAGALAGLIVTVGIGFGLSRVLYGVQAIDPIVLGGVASVMAAVALMATFIPARRASRADPVAAMRE